MTTPSLRIGSTALGWQEFGADSALGVMTRAMPGGDGSLDFTLPGAAAGRRRNVLIEGAECILDTGDDRWGGLIVGDPMAGFYSAQPLVSVAAAGLWSHAANRRDVARVWAESDPTRWLRMLRLYDSGDPDGWVDYVDQGKFTVDTEGLLYLRGHSDRTYAAGARAGLAFWLGGGRDSGERIVGVDIEYKANFPTDWELRLRCGVGTPWAVAKTGDLEWSDATTRSAWRAEAIDLATPATAAVLNLYYNSATPASPATNPFANVRSVTVWCRMDGAAVDRTIYLSDAMSDLAQLTGLATETRIPVAFGAAQPQLALRPDSERSVADGLRELAAMHDDFAEYGFDRTATGWRFTANELPTTVDPTRNRHWVLDDGRAGEDTSGVVRDPESAPDFVRVLHLASGVADVGNGQPRSVCYPSEPTSFTDRVALHTDQADVKLTDAQALAIATRLHTQLNSASFAGEAVLGKTALTVADQELPSRLMRPGDRVNILGRQGATDLYVAETSYDWSTGKLSATIGWPFDVITRGKRAVGAPGERYLGNGRWGNA